MACEIRFGSDEVPCNNMQFARLIDLLLEVGERTATAGEQAFVARMRELNDTSFWPGRGIDIAADFPDLGEQKFWCRVCFDTARAIIDRSVGFHEHQFWQAQTVWQVYGTGILFEDAVHTSEPKWQPDTVDGREFNRVINGW